MTLKHTQANKEKGLNYTQEWLFNIDQTTKIEGFIQVDSKESVKNVIEDIMDNLDKLIKCKKKPPHGYELEHRITTINIYVQKRR